MRHRLIASFASAVVGLATPALAQSASPRQDVDNTATTLQSADGNDEPEEAKPKEVKPEEVKPEEVKPEEVKQEEAKQEEAKQEEAKKEEAKEEQEEVKQEEKQEEVKQEQPPGTLTLQLPVVGALRLRPVLNTRIRGEYVGSRALDGAAAITPITHRMRAGVDARAGVIGAVVEIQDTRLWGAEAPAPEQPADPTLYGTVAGSVDVHQAYITLRTAALELRVGRQEVVIANDRLFGNVDFVMRGRVFDAVRFLAKTPQLTFTTFGAVITDADAKVTGQGDQLLASAAADLSLPLGTLSPLVAYDATLALERHRVTAGTRYTSGWVGDTSIDVEAFGQGTSVAAEAKWAWLGGARLQQRFSTVLAPKVGALVDVVSGTDGTGNTTAFDTLFATNHRFYGFQDLFLNLPVHTRGLGLVDVSPTVALDEGPLSVKLFAHVMMPYAVPAEGFSLYGIEPDVVAAYTIQPGVVLEAGCSMFVPLGTSLGRGSSPTPWAYLQLAWVL
jgi:flagellar motor protein MotB